MSAIASSHSYTRLSLFRIAAIRNSLVRTVNPPNTALNVAQEASGGIVCLCRSLSAILLKRANGVLSWTFVAYKMLLDPVLVRRNVPTETRYLTVLSGSLCRLYSRALYRHGQRAASAVLGASPPFRPSPLPPVARCASDTLTPSSHTASCIWIVPSSFAVNHVFRKATINISRVLRDATCTHSSVF